MLLLLIGDSMDMLDNIRATLGVNNNLSPEIKNDIFELVVIFNKKFPDVDLTRLRSSLSSLKIEKLNRFLNNDVSMYDNRTNTLYLNSSKLTDEYDGKHILMFELLNMISSNDTQMGFNRDGRFEALNIGYTGISLLEIAKICCLSTNSGLYTASSLRKISYSLAMLSLSAGTKNNKIELRSICRKNRKPKPFPSEAPSIIPGISAIQKDLLSRYDTIPKLGTNVVNG